jgi:hypothetical protein
LVPLIDLVNEQLDDNAVSQLSQQLGVDPNTTRQAVPAALTALLGGLSHNATQPAGAEQLLGALTKDHDGSVLDNLGGLLGGGGGGAVLGQQGAGILGHIFGNRQPQVANQVGRASGLNASTASQLLMMLSSSAPSAALSGSAAWIPAGSPTSSPASASGSSRPTPSTGVCSTSCSTGMATATSWTTWRAWPAAFLAAAGGNGSPKPLGFPFPAA